jgi:hypothetical protein
VHDEPSGEHVAIEDAVALIEDAMELDQPDRIQ